MARMEGQPYAVLNYQLEWRGDMSPNLIRSLVMNLLISGLLIWLLGQLRNPTLFRRVMLAVAVGMVGFMFFPYSNFIWFKNPDILPTSWTPWCHSVWWDLWAMPSFAPGMKSTLNFLGTASVLLACQPSYRTLLLPRHVRCGPSPFTAGPAILVKKT